VNAAGMSPRPTYRLRQSVALAREAQCGHSMVIGKFSETLGPEWGSVEDLRLNPHLHVVFLDEAYHQDGAAIAWEELGHLHFPARMPEACLVIKPPETAASARPSIRRATRAIGGV
jgi:hypothetical protein